MTSGDKVLRFCECLKIVLTLLTMVTWPALTLALRVFVYYNRIFLKDATVRKSYQLTKVLLKASIDFVVVFYNFTSLRSGLIILYRWVSLFAICFFAIDFKALLQNSIANFSFL